MITVGSVYRLNEAGHTILRTGRLVISQGHIGVNMILAYLVLSFLAKIAKDWQSGFRNRLVSEAK